MKLKTALLLLLFLPIISTAQLKHYFSYNLVYSNFYNNENDFAHLFKPLFNLNGSYKLEKNKIGIEIHYNSLQRYYNVFQWDMKNNTLQTLKSRHLELLMHYQIIRKKQFAINSMFGIVKNRYWIDIFDFWIPGDIPRGHAHTEGESKFGIQVGINAIAPIYKGLYANSNIRFTGFPTGELNKKTLFIEVGLGYVFSRKNITK